MEPALARVVLVVDDEPLVREITEIMLIDLGCEVVTAGDAKEALEKLATDIRIEILITDINMPGMDGCELAAAAVRIRKRPEGDRSVWAPKRWLRLSSHSKTLFAARPAGNDEKYYGPLLKLRGDTAHVYPVRNWT